MTILEQAKEISKSTEDVEAVEQAYFNVEHSYRVYTNTPTAKTFKTVMERVPSHLLHFVASMVNTTISDLQNYWLSTREVPAMRQADYISDVDRVEIFDKYPTLLFPKLKNRVTKARSEAKFDKSAKSLELNKFSMIVFKKHLESSKKISGIDATRYLSKLPEPSTDSEIDIRSEYEKLIWDNVKVKSLQLGKDLMSNYKKSKDHSKRAFYPVDSHGDLRGCTSTGDWATAVHFPYYTISRFASEYNIPLASTMLQLSESNMHRYITGVPKKNKLTEYDILYAVDKVKVLTHMRDVVDPQCPYYQMAIDQLHSELMREDTKERAVKYINTSSASIISANQAITELKGL